MTDYFRPELSEDRLGSISVLGLAHLGDGVFELMVRTWLCCHGRITSRGLHRETVNYVSAPAQAEAVNKILGMLSEDELAVYRRGRNTRVNSIPQHADISQYHAATGLEALFGWLYLHGETPRLNQLFEKIMEDSADAT
ncbi:MAG: Mini-ribonuclease 3 [Oscillospiraceae bacterium]